MLRHTKWQKQLKITFVLCEPVKSLDKIACFFDVCKLPHRAQLFGVNDCHETPG